VSVVAADHPVRRLTLQKFLELLHVFVAPRGRSGGPIDEALATRGLRRQIAVQVPTFLLVPEILAGTRYVATIPTRMAELLSLRYPLRQLAVPIAVPGFTMCQAWHEVHRDDPCHRWLRSACARVGSSGHFRRL
jgi:DNA-binding transcriptional LysR family regulator